MILTKHASLGFLPAIVTMSGSVIAIFIFIFAMIYVQRSPVLIVRGANKIESKVDPVNIDDQYIKSVSTWFLERYSSWNSHDFAIKRAESMAVCNPIVAESIELDTKNLSNFVKSMNFATTISVRDIFVKRHGSNYWSISIFYDQTPRYDRSVGLPTTKTMQLIMRKTTPSDGSRFCVEITGISDQKAEKTESSTGTTK